MDHLLVGDINSTLSQFKFCSFSHVIKTVNFAKIIYSEILNSKARENPWNNFLFCHISLVAWPLRCSALRKKNVNFKFDKIWVWIHS